MNGKQSKKLREIANQKAISWKETTTQGVKAWKTDLSHLYVDPRVINVKGDVFFQRKLHPLSVGAIVKKLKRLFRATPRPQRNEVFDSFEYFLYNLLQFASIKYIPCCLLHQLDCSMYFLYP